MSFQPVHALFTEIILSSGSYIALDFDSLPLDGDLTEIGAGF
jgi:hypothetical protein